MKIYVQSATTDTTNRIKIARTTNDPKLLSRLAYDPNRTVREIISKNANLPEYAMQQLAKDPSVDIRKRIANRTKDSKVFSILANDIDKEIRRIVAERCENQKVLEDMIFDDSDIVREIIATKITDPEVLAMLIEDENPSVRLAVANTTKDMNILKALKNDSDEEVSSVAAKRYANRNSSRVRPADRFRGKYDEQPYTDWSISPFEISSYSEIEDEIDEVIDISVDEYATSKGKTASVDIDGSGYDTASTFKILFYGDSGKVEQTYSADIEEILAPATSNNKKEKCIQNVVRWLKRNFG